MRDERGVPAPLAGLVITAIIMAGVVMVGPGDEFATTRRLLGFGDVRRSAPPEVTPGSGSFAFLQTQRGSDEPVAWDPCRPLEYSVNPDDAPAGWEQLVGQAVAEVEEATGLDLVDAGQTDERPFAPSYAGMARPVVIGFADDSEIPALAGATAGLGGSSAERSALGRDYYVAGSVALDTAVFTDRALEVDPDSLRAIVQHELGHVLGLDHVADPGELMAESNLGRTGWGPGDREGLARLASVPCR